MAEAMPELDSALQLRRESTAQQVAGALRELIVTGGFPPGAHLREGPLAQRLGVSRNTVREAVQILVSEGLVSRELHRGAYVARLSADDVRDLFRVRRLVELTAVREIAGSGRLDPLQEGVRALAAAVESGDRHAVAEADLELHNQLVELMGSERLGALYQGVSAELRVSIARAAPVSPDPQSLLKDHRAILSALERGDAAAAAKRLQRHLDASEQILVAGLEATSITAGAAAT